MPAHSGRGFSERFGALRVQSPVVRETGPAVSERVIQCVWYDQLFQRARLATVDGMAVAVESPGWWNRGPGPDFRDARIVVDGQPLQGDVELHLRAAGWNEHGHDQDPRYDNVVLHVVLEDPGNARITRTASGAYVPVLCLAPYLQRDLNELAEQLLVEDYPCDRPMHHGRCSALIPEQGTGPVLQWLRMAGEWRMLNKARALRQRAEHAGEDQALYEAFVTACGYGHFKHHFAALARSLPYDRVRQLAQSDPMLVEAAMLQLAGLLPESLPEGSAAVPHFARLRGLRRDALPGLRSLPLTWRRTGVRPVNYPERRIAGAARVLARTADDGFVQTLERIWRAGGKPIETRRAFEALFPRPVGFWATHCTWTGKALGRPTSTLGPGRMRSIIGNVFIPAALAREREKQDRARETQVLDFFAALPREPGNHIVTLMVPRLFAAAPPPRLDFRLQQGLIQAYHDWCAPNPGCIDCAAYHHLDQSYRADG